MKERITYLDVAKFIGIFCIYLGHFGNLAGNAYYFVFIFHVPLFFFLSGCSERLSADVPLHTYVLKTVKTILIPYFFFSLASLALETISSNTHTELIPNLIIILSGGTRNRFFAGGLWFLTCLFVVKISFCLLRKVLKYRPLILAVCLGLFVTAEYVISPRPIVMPHMAYNLDSACYYIIYYALGYCCFDPIRRLLSWEKPWQKAVCAGAGLVFGAYTLLLFFGKNPLTRIAVNPAMNVVLSILCPMIVVCFILIVSKLLENVRIFEELGRNTLYLCGFEYIIKRLVPLCLELVGLGITIADPLAAYVYTFALLVLCSRTLVPLGKSVLRKAHLLKA